MIGQNQIPKNPKPLRNKFIIEIYWWLGFWESYSNSHYMDFSCHFLLIFSLNCDG